MHETRQAYKIGFDQLSQLRGLGWYRTLIQHSSDIVSELHA
jgi:hypothetical protein